MVSAVNFGRFLYINDVKFITPKQLFLLVRRSQSDSFQVRTGDSEVTKDIGYFCIFLKFALERRFMPQSSCFVPE